MLICFACIPLQLLSFCSGTNKGGCRVKRALQLEFYNPQAVYMIMMSQLRLLYHIL